ncbi:cation:proton antiporter [Chloroflexota bacterium]
MMVVLGIFLTLVFLVSLVSKRAQKTIITAPMLFTLAGILVVLTFSEFSQVEIKGHSILMLAEITLAVVLFTDATRISLRQVNRESQLPARLLGIGMPLTILTGMVVAVLLFSDLTVWEAAILATILAPTDASLGAAVVNSRLVPARIRQALSVESGLNDGLSIPLLMLFIALAQVESPTHDTSWIVFTAQQIGFGLLVGLALGWVGGRLMANAERRSWMTKAAQQLALLALAVLSWGFAEKMIGGNGFIAAFVAGSMIKYSFDSAHERMADFDEAWGNLLTYFIFFLFGAIAAPFLGVISGLLWLYALLSLTLVRMLPVAIALIGARLQRASVLFLGWFGPRGLASIVLGLIFLEEKTNLAGEAIIQMALIATVLLSIFAHGISAYPAINKYAQQVQSMGPDAPEKQEAAPAQN